MAISDKYLQFLGQMQTECLLANGKQSRPATVNAAALAACAKSAALPLASPGPSVASQPDTGDRQ